MKTTFYLMTIIIVLFGLIGCFTDSTVPTVPTVTLHFMTLNYRK